MTTAPVDFAATDAPPRARSWRPRLVELLLVGGVTPILFPISWLLRRGLGLDLAEQLAVGFTMFHAAFVINDPHFAATYLLFYEDAKRRALDPAIPFAQRARYWFAGLAAPALLVAWALAGLLLRSPPALGWLFQLMFFLVGWHYVKQGFGVMSVLAARRGVRFLPRERLAILAHCFAGWAYAWTSKPNLGREVEEKGVVYTPFVRWHALDRIALAALVVSVVPMAFLLAKKWKREGLLPIATPLTAFLASVWLWSIFSGIDPLVRYVVPALHSIQYLFIVWLLKRNEAKGREGPPWFETSAWSRLGLFAASAILLGFVLFHGAPSLLDDLFLKKGQALTDLGPTPWFAALYAIVNLHHYFMDNVIWRREHAPTRWLRS